MGAAGRGAGAGGGARGLAGGLLARASRWTGLIERGLIWKLMLAPHAARCIDKLSAPLLAPVASHRVSCPHVEATHSRQQLPCFHAHCIHCPTRLKFRLSAFFNCWCWAHAPRLCCSCKCVCVMLPAKVLPEHGRHTRRRRGIYKRSNRRNTQNRATHVDTREQIYRVGTRSSPAPRMVSRL